MRASDIGPRRVYTAATRPTEVPCPASPGVPENRVGPLGRLLYAIVRRQSGGRLADTWPIANHAPGILRAMVAKEYFLDRTRNAPPGLRKLAELKVAVMVGCPG